MGASERWSYIQQTYNFLTGTVDDLVSSSGDFLDSLLQIDLVLIDFGHGDD